MKCMLSISVVTSILNSSSHLQEWERYILEAHLVTDRGLLLPCTLTEYTHTDRVPPRSDP